MAKNSTSTGGTNSVVHSTASRKSKLKSYVVNNPLSPSRISWLRQQSKRVAEVSILRLTTDRKI
jgi:hypothetical protein